MAFTLDDLSSRTGISKPYLSLIETGRVVNPPSDEKLQKLERVLEFSPGELLTQAHLQRTPRDVRDVLQRLIDEGTERKAQDAADAISSSKLPEPAKGRSSSKKGSSSGTRPTGLRTQDSAPSTTSSPLSTQHSALSTPSSSLRTQDSGLRTSSCSPINLDDAFLSGVLQELVDRSAGNIEAVRIGSVPVINRVSAGYPSDFTDLSFPPRVADSYIGCPDLSDPDAFAARIHGDSMTPKYQQDDIVIFSPALSPRDGQDCFVRFEDGQTTFKRVFTEAAEDGVPMLRLQPRNERYRPQIVPQISVSGLYPAVYQYRRIGEE